LAWVGALKGQLVGVDSSPFIYYVEDHPNYIEVVRPFFEAVGRGELQAVTSVVSLLELLVHPNRRNDRVVANKYRDILLNSGNITCREITTEIAELAAVLRSEHRIHTPDAIQMATGVLSGATYFLTNDARLPSLPGMKVVMLDEIRQDPLR
jgi:predicted nucleic acid-binding protein